MPQMRDDLFCTLTIKKQDVAVNPNWYDRGRMSPLHSRTVMLLCKLWLRGTLRRHEVRRTNETARMAEKFRCAWHLSLLWQITDHHYPRQAAEGLVALDTAVDKVRQ